MGRLSASLLALAFAAVAALGLAACGGGSDAELLPGSTASEITSNLDQVKQLATEGDCIGAEDAAQAVSAQIEELGGVDAKLKQALREGATRLNEVVAGCEEETVEETLPAIEPAEELEEAEEKGKKEKPEKPEKSEEQSEEEGETEEGTPSLPPQAKGEAKGHEQQEEEVPPTETGGGTPSGGVGPGTEVGGD
jgi:hypothetical protein